ncbi:MAG: NADH-quinone oxidoreductase subunit M [Planctomycetota bacterium]
MLLATLILLPTLAALAILALPKAMAKTVALGASFLELALALLLLGSGLGGTTDAFAPAWLQIESLNLGVNLGIGPVSYWLVLLTAALMPLVFLSSFGAEQKAEKGYYFWLTLLVTPMVGTFLARDAILFYVFFELTLVPMFFLIGIWGGLDREYAAKKFFLYTFVGGVFTLAGLLFIGINAGTFDLAEMARWAQGNVTNPTAKVLLFVALFAGFAVKVPLFPVHTWLPLAHTVAPTAGSVILAGVLLKLGTYGLLAVAIPLGLISSVEVSPDGIMPVIGNSVIPVVAILSIIGVIYGALIAWVQKDVKKLVAYSSVSHLGFCVLGLVALNDHGMQGSVFYMINHGISTGALFLLIGMIYDRYHTRMFDDYSGLGKVMPVFSFFLVLFTMSSIGLPGTNGFVSEFLTILGAFTSPYLGPIYGAAAALGVVLGAIYMLHMVAKLVFGPLKLPTTGHSAEETPGKSLDLNPREVAILTPLAVLVIVLGVFPSPLLQSVTPDVQAARSPQAATMVVETPVTVEQNEALAPLNLAAAETPPGTLPNP